jgi:reverse gyrase
MIYTKFCKCGGSILTLEQMETDQLCDRCREEQVKEMEKSNLSTIVTEKEV